MRDWFFANVHHVRLSCLIKVRESFRFRGGIGIGNFDVHS
jgi:hypothetical protein